MATTVTSSIGSAGGRDYSTLATWEAACPANLVTSDQIWRGECYNDSEFVVAGTPLTISGITTDATRYIILTAAAGQSFQDHASVRTNPLYYDATKGVGIRSTGSYNRVIDVLCDNVHLSRLQIQAPDDSQAKGVFFNTQNDCTVTDCIIHAREVTPFTVAPNGIIFTNCLLIMRGAGKIIGLGGGNGNRFEFCTIIGSGGSSDAGSIGYATLTVENCAIFNFATGFSTTTGGTLAGGFNCTDLASAPGSSNQVSKTFSAQFESTTNDFRAKSGGDLANGTPATGYATTDISGTTRNATTPYIGAWELVSGSTVKPWYAYAQQ